MEKRLEWYKGRIDNMSQWIAKLLTNYVDEQNPLEFSIPSENQEEAKIKIKCVEDGKYKILINPKQDSDENSSDKVIELWTQEEIEKILKNIENENENFFLDLWRWLIDKINDIETEEISNNLTNLLGDEWEWTESDNYDFSDNIETLAEDAEILKNYNDLINQISGDTSVSLENAKSESWIVFYVKTDSSFSVLEGWDWAKIQISDLDDNAMTHTIKVQHFLNSTDSEFKYEGYPLLKWKEVLEGIKRDYKDELMKFSSIENIGRFENYLDTMELDDRSQRYQSNLEPWKRLKFNWAGVEKQDQDGNYQEVKYIWKTVKEDGKDKNAFFSVEFHGDRVKLSWQWGWWGVFEVSYESFLFFVSEKWLQPFTEDEYNKSFEWGQDWANTENILGGLQFISAGAWWKIMKAYPDAIKKKRKDQEDFAAAQLKVGMYQKLWKLWGNFAAISEDAVQELDQKIISRINNEKESFKKLDTEWAEQAEVDATASVRKIKDEVFDATPWKDPYKALWALYFALESGGWLYFRDLNSFYKWGMQWKWVEAILGSKEAENFRKNYENLIIQANNSPNDSATIDKLAKYELQYLQSIIGRRPEQFWSKVGWDLANFVQSQFSVSTARDMRNDMKSKKTFEELYWDISGVQAQLRPNLYLGMLEALSEKVETTEQYDKWYSLLILPILTWVAYHTWWKTLKDEYEKLCRSFGFPLWLYIHDYHWPRKISVLFDIVSRANNKESFSEKVDYKKILNNTAFEEEGVKEVFKKLQNWMEENSSMLIDDINLKNKTLLEKLDQEDWLTEEERNVLKEFLDKKANDKWDGYESFEMDGEDFIKRGFWVLGKQFVQKEAHSSRWYQSKKLEWKSAIFWQTFKNEFESLSKEQVDKEKLRFILKKFFTWFDFSWEEIKKQLSHIFAKKEINKLTPSKQEKFELWGRRVLYEYEKDYDKISQQIDPENSGSVKPKEALDDLIKQEILWPMLAWNMSERDLDNRITEWMDAFTLFLANNIDKIDEQLMEELFGEDIKNHFNKVKSWEGVSNIRDIDYQRRAA